MLYDYCGDDAVLLSRTYDNGAAPDETFFYRYDVFNRIQEVEHSALGSIEAYSYDLANNPEAARVGPTAPAWTYDYTPPPTAEPRFQRASLAAGDVIDYDSDDRVTKRSRGGVTRGFAYDGQSRVVQASITRGGNTATKDYWYAPGNGIVEEVGTGPLAGTTHRLKGFRVIDGVRYASVLPWLTIRNGEAVYTLDEPDGRAAMMLDVNGVALSERYISAYGTELYGTGSMNWPMHGLHGAEPDNTLEVAHFGARHMSFRGGGLWLQREPLLRLGVPQEATATPRHFSGAYAGGNPVNWHDGTGNFTAGWALEAAHRFVEMEVAKYDAEYQSDPSIAENRPARHAGYLAVAMALAIQEEMPVETMIVTGRAAGLRAPRVRAPSARPSGFAPRRTSRRGAVDFGGRGGDAAKAAPSVVDRLRPGGVLIGRAGTSKKIRFLEGGATEAETLFKQLTAGGRAVEGSSYPGQLVDLPGGGRIGFRPTSTSGPPTIDVMGVEGLSVREIKFIPGGE